jgi:hypothetical protein
MIDSQLNVGMAYHDYLALNPHPDTADGSIPGEK